MRNSILALPALLRPAVFLACASQTAFSVHDDLLAFPQYEIAFSPDYVSETFAHARLQSYNDQINNDGAVPSHLAQYRLSDSNQPPQDDTRQQHQDEALKLTYETLTLNNQRYLCGIPQPRKNHPNTNPNINNSSANSNSTRTAADEERELARATDRGWELLEGMQGNCVYFISGWWSYKFCYGDVVRQFHQLPPSKGVPPFPPMEDPGIEAFTLGKYEGPSVGEERSDGKEGALDVSRKGKEGVKGSQALGELVQQGQSRYLVQRLEGGTKCDLTGRDRRIEVQFHCNPKSPDRISLIKETSTCAYLMVIQTPRLCNDVAFLPPEKDKPNPITCSPILPSDLDSSEDETPPPPAPPSGLRNPAAVVPNTKVREAQAEAAKIFTPNTHPSPQQIVGDIVVGARRLLPPDFKLEKSSIVGGGKETYIDTVASSDGKMLSKEDLERLGLGNAEAVQELMEKLRKYAGGQEWKLDVIDTPRGREYRGIIGSEEDGDEDGEKEGEGDEEGSKEEYYHEEL